MTKEATARSFAASRQHIVSHYCLCCRYSDAQLFIYAQVHSGFVATRAELSFSVDMGSFNPRISNYPAYWALCWILARDTPFIIAGLRLRNLTLSILYILKAFIVYMT